jgi:hypothetical protein
MADLWKLIRKDNNNQTLPVLLPTSSSPNAETQDLASIYSVTRLYSGVNAASVINVVDDFQWTKSPKSSRYNTPTIRLIEKRLLLNSVLTNIANSIFTSVEAGSTVFGTGATSLVQQGINSGPAGIATFLRTPAAAPENSTSNANQQGFVAKLISETEQAAIQAANSIRGTAGGKELADLIDNNVTPLYSSFQLGNPVLTPYNFLYATEKTGFVYDLPFLNNNSLYSGGLSFGEDNKNILGGSIASTFSDVARGAVAFTTAIKPGTYIERSKQYSMGDNGRAVTVQFPLLNTGEFKDIVQNWQLLFGLIYQNRPGRVTRAIIDMPVIYEVNCPGVVYMPFSYIRSLSVEFIGSRREITFNVPVGDENRGGSTTLTTVVPDAYQVTIELEGMNEETRNFLYASVSQSPVTVTGGN